MFTVKAVGGKEPIEWHTEDKNVALVTAMAMSDRYPTLGISIHEPGSDDCLYRIQNSKVVFDLSKA